VKVVQLFLQGQKFAPRYAAEKIYRKLFFLVFHLEKTGEDYKKYKQK
jgi:hypothetical protein